MTNIDTQAAALGAKEAIDEYILAGTPEMWKVQAPNPKCLATYACAMAAVHRVSRGTLGWGGPGVYELYLIEGASQAQDWTKMDDATVECVFSRSLGD